MGSHHVIVLKFDRPLTKREYNYLAIRLGEVDWNFDVNILYHDGIRGTWKNPFKNEILEILKEYSSNILFKAFKCEYKECSCHDMGKDYGCVWFGDASDFSWDKRGIIYQNNMIVEAACE